MTNTDAERVSDIVARLRRDSRSVRLGLIADREHYANGMDAAADIIEAQSKALAEARVEIERLKLWQPIETVPRDGTWVLVHQDGTTRSAKWIDTSEERQEEVSRSGKRATYEWVLHRSGYWECDDIYYPTHWQPLPTPPLPTPTPENPNG